MFGLQYWWYAIRNLHHITKVVWRARKNKPFIFRDVPDDLVWVFTQIEPDVPPWDRLVAAANKEQEHRKLRALLCKAINKAKDSHP